MQYRSARFGPALFLFLAFCSTLALADGLLVTNGKAISLLESDGLSVVRSVEVKKGGVAAMAVHPTGSVLASVSADGQLTFWNLPGLEIASQKQDALFQAITALEFSADGGSLYLLSQELGAVVVFDLSASKVAALLPVPGGETVSLSVFGENLLVHQAYGAVVLAGGQEAGMVAQVKFPESVSSVATLGDRLYFAREGAQGVDVYRASVGQFLGLVAVGSRPRGLLFSKEQPGLMVLTEAGALQKWDLSKEAPLWTFSSQGQAYDQLLLGNGVGLAFLLEGKSGAVVGVNKDSGSEVVRGHLGGAVKQAVFYSGTP